MKTLMDLKLPLHTPLFIDGSEGASAGGGTLLRENPARSAEIVTISQEGSVADAHAAIAAARYAFDHNVKGWVTDARQREQVLRRTALLVREEAQRLAQMVSLEVGMPARQATPHVLATADIFDFYAGYATKLYGEAMSLANGSFINLLREPVGVVGMILPWNFPLTQAARKLAPAFAADIEWPTYGLDLSNQRYATPSQINTGNVGKLTRAWAYKSGVKATFQSTPIMVDRTVYLSLPFNGVVALDAVSGRQLWRYEHLRKKDYPMCCGPANRGVAVADGKVFMGTVDARLVALDAESGKVLWDVEVAEADSARQESVTTLTESDPLRKASIAGQSGVGIAMAPVVHKGKVLIGVTGVGYGLHLDSDRDGAPLGAVVGFAGNYGRPGFLAAFDVHTGKRVWQFDTIDRKSVV